MVTKQFFAKALTMLAISALLVSCGGGGGGGGADPIIPFKMVITIDDPGLLTNEGEVAFEPGSDFASGVTVRLTRNDGQAVTATVVNLAVPMPRSGRCQQLRIPQFSPLNCR